MAAELPFDITARLAERGQVMFVASMDGKEVTAERYAPGDGDRRRKVARRWASDERLTHNGTIQHDLVVRELERVEQEALAEFDKLAASDRPGPRPVKRASYASDATMAELAWNLELNEPDFIVLDREARQVHRSDSVETPAGLIVVPAICEGIVTPGGDVDGSVLLPTTCDWRRADDAALREDIAAFIDSYVELPDEGRVLAIEYTLLTWVHDVFDELPYLAFRTADVGRGKSRALETIGALCYRPLFIGGGSSAAATLRLLHVFGGTLVADEFDQRRDTELAADLNRILNQGFQKRRPLVKCDGEDNAPKPFRCFGPKVFALRTRLGDDATESRTLSVQMVQRTRSDIPLSLPRARFDAEALALRNRLLAWRFANYHAVRIDPSLSDSRLEDRANQIGLPLLAVARTAETRTLVIAALRAQQGSLAASRAETLAAEVFTAILDTAKAGDLVRPINVANTINHQRADAAGVPVDKLGRQTVTPHRVGRILSGELELPCEGRDRTGMRYRLERARVLQLAQRLGIPLPETTQTTSSESTLNLHVQSSSQHAPLQELTNAPATRVDSVVSSGTSDDRDDAVESTSPETPEERLRRLEDAPDLRDVHGLWDEVER